jgi:5-methylcytosine-specific restriction protein A
MESIQKLLEKVLHNYLSEKFEYKKAKKTVPLYKTVVQDLPRYFQDLGNISNEIKIEGSIGKGMITYTPWLCFFDKEITTSAQHGYYVCMLFREDMKGFYLSLNQGWTQYQTQFGVKAGRNEISLNSIKARTILRSTKNFQADVLNLNASTDLGKGYELGNIYSRYYSVDNVPNDKKLFEDLQQLLGAYRELKGLVGDNILNIRSLSSEEDFQEESQSTKKAELPAGPLKKPEQKSKNSSISWPRNPGIAKAALLNVNHTCEYDSSHKTFISSSTGNSYVEVHHLVPMEKQADYDVSLDVPENIVALCPNCHRKIHLASKVEKDPMLEKFLGQRMHTLASRGILITLDDLRTIYKQLD